MTRFGAVDCGTNSIRLLITDVRRGDDGVLELTELHRVMEIVRLGEGVDATGRLADAALQRVREALTGFAELMRVERVEAVRMVATSASRDASNRDDFFSMTREILADWGVEAQVISGDEEAALSFRGAVDDFHPEEGPFCVIDVGGGSTEVVVGDYDGTVHAAVSVPMGSVRLTERFLVDSPPTPEQVKRAHDYVAGQVERVLAEVPVAGARTIVGCAGTYTTLSALAQGLETYDPSAIHLSTLRFSALRSLNQSVLATDRRTLAENPVMHPGRADVFAGGVMVIDGLMDMFEAVNGAAKEKGSRGDAVPLEFHVSEKDILDGIVAGLVDEKLADAEQ
ncbi:Ppx/GppA phosphatase family protein [Corynebacterium freneyi]|uniref:Ppx/GppA phosphatase family protein n=1 Tax=Corynebacterium freneyi TaxID=134034 RepID=UPI001CCEC088|nr:Ppx/GppA phosphatase family protein [Corynebacterium freneyi]UBI01826.1 Ppx/GppA family phosphatase [Corynebacterium freneyi]